MTSSHYKQDRKERENIIKNYIGYGKIVDRFVVDKHHKNGAEIHCITTTGIIIIFNKRTHKLITKLIARPNQIKRYYKNNNYPIDIVKKAYYNTNVKHYNY